MIKLFNNKKITVDKLFILLSLILTLSLIGCATAGGIGQAFDTPCSRCDEITNRNNVINEWPCPDCSSLGGFVERLPGWYCTTCENRGVISVFSACVHRDGEGSRNVCVECGRVNCQIDHTVREIVREPVRTEPPPVHEPITIVEPTSPTFREVRDDRMTTWTVRRGDTLMGIARRADVYNDANRWRDIYNANRGQISNPNRIYPGQVLIIPR